MKKTLAVMLAVIMLMMISITAFAEAGPWIPETDVHRYQMIIDESCWIDVPAGSYEGWCFVPESNGCYIIHTFIEDDCPNADPEITVYLTYDNDEPYQIAYNDDYYDYESAVCFYALAGVEYHIDFSDAQNNENDTSYSAMIISGCGDFDYDGHCDSCWEILCSHSCHNNGFFWRIVNFFNRLFGINEYCECGAWHWGRE